MRFAVHVASKHKSTCNWVLSLHTKSHFMEVINNIFLKMKCKRMEKIWILSIIIIIEMSFAPWHCMYALDSKAHMASLPTSCSTTYWMHASHIAFLHLNGTGKWFRTFTIQVGKTAIYSLKCTLTLVPFHTTWSHSVQCGLFAFQSVFKYAKYVPINGFQFKTICITWCPIPFYGKRNDFNVSGSVSNFNCILHLLKRYKSIEIHSAACENTQLKFKSNGNSKVFFFHWYFHSHQSWS